MTLLVQRHFRPRRIIGLAPLIALAVTADRAEAACTPASSASDSTVNCSGTTTNSGPGGRIGYGSPDDNNNTYNIQAGATVEGNLFGLRFGTGATINNSGTILGPNASGIIGSDVVRNVATINNVSTGVISGHIGIGVTTLTLNNAGKVFGTGLPEAAVDVGLSAIVTNESTGEIAGGRFGVRAAFVANVDNAGDIRATAPDGVGISASTVNVTSNTSDISGGLGGIDAANLATVANAGHISGGDFGIRSGGNVNVTNSSGFIVGALLGVGGGHDVTVSNFSTIGAGPTGSGINALGTATVKNADTGGISGGQFGIVADVAKVDNAGGIAAAAANGVGIRAFTAADVTNTGTISAERANGIAIWARTATVTNFGTILAGANGTAIFADTATVINKAGGSMSGGSGGIEAINSINLNNAGSISATSFAVHARTVDLMNSGRISTTAAHGNAVNATNATVNNSGTILAEADGTGIVAINANVMNTGTISAGDTAIDVGVANVFNSGIISGKIGIVASRPDIGGSTLDNSGTIIGTGGTAIKLTSAADTLTLRPGSRIVGVVDMGLGNDVVNVAVNAPNTRVSTLSSVAIPTFINFTGVINTTFSGGNNANPAVSSGTTLATLDPTALALADRALLDFTGGVSSLVQGRLNGASPSANGSMMAMAYAPDSERAGGFVKAPGVSGWSSAAPITVWANSFGGQRTQDETAATLRATNTAWSAAGGIDRKIRPNWLVGAFIGGGAEALSVDLGSQRVDTDYLFAGGYSRFEWAAQFLDFTVQGGSSSNKSNRLVLNNGAMETARASYDGWFISPEFAYGMRYQIGNGYLLTPTARVRYVAGFFDGYTEQGSAQNLTVGSRTLQNFEERAQLEVSKTTGFFGGDHTLKTSVHGGVIAQQRVGDATVNTVLIGQGLSFATPGKGSAVGAVFGAGFDYHTAKNVALFGAVEGIAMSDQSHIGTARGGVRVAF